MQLTSDDQSGHLINKSKQLKLPVEIAYTDKQQYSDILH